MVLSNSIVHRPFSLSIASASDTDIGSAESFVLCTQILFASPPQEASSTPSKDIFFLNFGFLN